MAFSKFDTQNSNAAKVETKPTVPVKEEPAATQPSSVVPVNKHPRHGGAYEIRENGEFVKVE